MMLCKPDFESQVRNVTALLHRYNPRKSDPIYGYWFFEAYYESFLANLVTISSKFAPKNEAGIDELLSFKADM